MGDADELASSGADPGGSVTDGGASSLVVNAGDGRVPRWFWRVAVSVMAAVALFQFGRYVFTRLSGLLLLVVLSLFLSFAVEPAVDKLEDRGWKRSVATLMCFLLVFVGTGIFLFVMGGLVVDQVTELVNRSPDYLDNGTGWINDTFSTELTTDTITEQIESYQSDLTGLAQNVGGRVLSVTGQVVGLIFQAFTVALFAYYMTSQGPKLRRTVCSVLPERNQRTVLLLWELAIQKTGGWLYSRLLLAVLASGIAWVAFALMGLPSPLALALWLGLISQYIPAIGTYLAGALPLLVALVNNPISAVYVIIFIAVYQQIENYLLSPKITSQTMDLHPAVAFGSAIAGGTLLGPLGAIMALPAAGVVQAFVSTILQRHEVVDSRLLSLEADESPSGQSAFRAAVRQAVRRSSGAGADAGA
ncbi:MAG: AI-2E family transporter, partial [Actinomycetota bacterium]